VLAPEGQREAEIVQEARVRRRDGQGEPVDGLGVRVPALQVVGDRQGVERLRVGGAATGNLLELGHGGVGTVQPEHRLRVAPRRPAAGRVEPERVPVRLRRFLILPQAVERVAEADRRPHVGPVRLERALEQAGRGGVLAGCRRSLAHLGQLGHVADAQRRDGGEATGPQRRVHPWPGAGGRQPGQHRHRHHPHEP
jgi:hypothetical protein